MFQFSCRFAFFINFSSLKPDTKNTRILTLYQANAATLTLFSKGDKISIKYLYECISYNAWQFITKFLSKAWTQNSINRLLVKFGTVDRRPGSGRRSAHWWKRRHSWVAVAESGRATEQSAKFIVKRGIHQSSVLWIHKDRHLQCCKKKCAQQLTEAHSMHALFSVCSLRDDKRDNKQTYMKTETCKLYSRVFW